ncbi:DUF2752 domain-containing protein [Aeromicrobium duanguangcaii]|uniref:DUF2752 domain-containing protein n=1 Tax=Aeromicrobium duanguangcaii TaxID=2968086 RepID=A0ABY5KGS1_9ACTN|nr:DUF2752 domain-containing protein [Aeromicrobium duanguangcaii]MCD9153221.1 DUF2752 domain-containing protein [Aeromicrobium duanguangcaii]MCL3836786.1 DUF2752 domain-containing protein [Aeromicrobium duanguangcaii]UUI69679.1 DUF2752 domain-containing protein [Aeromicrobium duanguangcaii]
MRAPLLAAAAGVGALALLHVRDPHVDGAYGFCPFLVLTGRPCPGCGGLRAMNLLTRGDLAGAVSSNLVAVSLLLVAAVAWLVWFQRRARAIPAPYLTWSARTVTLGGLAIVAFGVVRLTPWGAWLAP